MLLVHHTAGANSYGPEDVAGTLGSIYNFHTGDKGWPDVAYNFFIDRFGGVWEGRQGSVEAPMIGDATGGNQGFTQLACFIGDHSVQPPTPEALDSMVALLAGLADRYGVATDPGATATFSSRGSNKWPKGSAVTVPTIAGHRDLSQTACPGDAAYSIVTDQLQPRVSAVRLDGGASTTTAPPTTTAAAESSTVPDGPATTPASPPAAGEAGSTSTSGAESEPGSELAASVESEGAAVVPAGVIAAGAGLLVAGAIGARKVTKQHDS